MPQTQTHNNSGRKKLVITKAPEAKQITGKDGKLLDFIEVMAKVEGEDIAVKYTNWTKSFNDFFKLDAIVECDVVVTDQKNVDQDGNPYRNRKITQVYVDGQPVGKQQKQWGKSPETVAMEIDGKFRDTALMQACEFAKAEGANQTAAKVLALADKFYAWLKGSPEKPSDKAQDKGMVQSEDKKATVSPTESQKPIIDLAWLSETMKAVNWKDATLKSWLKMQFKTDTTGTIEDMLNRLNPNQANMLINHLKELAK